MTTTRGGDAARDAVRKQYGSVGNAYVTSAGHATGRDLQKMIDVAKSTPDTRMLDIATGGGHVARAFAPHVGSIVATDITPQMLAHAAEAFRTWGLDNVATQIADAEGLPFDDASFDLVTCRIAPHHFPHVDAFVREVYRVLTANGTFLLIDSTVPEGEDGAFYNRFEMLRDPSHVRSLTVEEWTDLLTTAGFVVAETEMFPKTHDFADWTARSRTSEDDIAALTRMFLDAPESTRETFVVLTDPDDPTRIHSFRDTKTLFVGCKEYSLTK